MLKSFGAFPIVVSKGAFAFSLVLQFLVFRPSFKHNILDGSIVRLHFSTLTTQVSHNIVLCRSPACRQNNSDPSRHGLYKSSEVVLWYLAQRC